MVNPEDLIYNVTKVRLTKYPASLELVRKLAEEYPEFKFSVPPIGAVGMVFNNRIRRGCVTVPIVFESFDNFQSESPIHVEMACLEISENPPEQTAIPLGSSVRLIELDPTHDGAGCAPPYIGLIGKVVHDSHTPKHRLCVEYAAGDLGYDVDLADPDDDTLRLYVLRHCLEEI